MTVDLQANTIAVPHKATGTSTEEDTTGGVLAAMRLAIPAEEPLPEPRDAGWNYATPAQGALELAEEALLQEVEANGAAEFLAQECPENSPVSCTVFRVNTSAE